MKRFLIFHPFGFAAFAVLFLFQQNIRETTAGDLFLPLGIAVGFAVLLFGIAMLLFRNAKKAGLVASLVVLLTFSYGHIADVTDGWRIFGITVGRDLYLFPFLVFVTAVGVFLVARARRSFGDATKILNSVAVVLVLMSLGGIAIFKIQHRDVTPSPAAAAKNSGPAAAAKGPQRDIYYLILEDYGDPRTLAKSYGFDDTPFIKQLEARGFYVAPRSTTNYPNSAHSIATALNLEYVNFLSKRAGSKSSDWGPVYGMLQDHKVGRFLQARGYKYVHIGSRWQPLATSKIADVNVKYDPLSEFSRLVLQTTIVDPISRHLGIATEKLDTRRVYYKQTLFQFKKIAQTRSEKGPKFVLAQIMLPHPPYMFDAKGHFVTAEEEKRRGRTLGFTDQIRFANAKVLDLLDRLQSGPEETRPIIILQTDEGPAPRPDKRNTNAVDATSWVTKTDQQLKQKFQIVDSFYLPGIADPGLYPTISTVNTFRKVFDLYFGADLPLLPDRNYIWRDLNHLYDFIDITDRVKS